MIRTLFPVDLRCGAPLSVACLEALPTAIACTPCASAE